MAMTDTDSERRLNDYKTGLVAALVLTGIPFSLVAWTNLASGTLLWIIAACGAVQVVAHIRYFLHVDLSRQKQDDLRLIRFAGLIILLMAGGTLWILYNLHLRMG